MMALLEVSSVLAGRGRTLGGRVRKVRVIKTMGQARSDIRHLYGIDRQKKRIIKGCHRLMVKK
jgi:hypothetical protein